MNGSLPTITPDEIQSTYPNTPPVTQTTIESATEELYLYLADKLDFVPPEDSLKWKALRRAIMAYSLYLTAGGAANTMLSTTESTGRAKRYKVGPIEVEKQNSDLLKDASAMQSGSDAWFKEFLRLLGLVVGTRLRSGVHPGAVR